MISSKKLIKMVRKWQKLAALSRKRIGFPTKTKEGVVDDADNCNTSTVDKGHFVVYTADSRRFVIPLAYLNNDIFRALLKMAEEEYGLPSGGPITLPCDAILMECVVSLIRRRASKNLEKALIASMSSGHCLSSTNLQQGLLADHQQLPICSF